MSELWQWKDFLLSLGWTAINIADERFTVQGITRSRGIALRVTIYAEHAKEADDFTVCIAPLTNHMDRETVKFSVATLDDLKAGLREIKEVIEKRPVWKETTELVDYYSAGPVKIPPKPAS